MISGQKTETNMIIK